MSGRVVCRSDLILLALVSPASVRVVVSCWWGWVSCSVGDSKRAMEEWSLRGEGLVRWVVGMVRVDLKWGSLRVGVAIDKIIVRGYSNNKQGHNDYKQG